MGGNNRWYEIWNNRKNDADLLNIKDEYSLFMELKRLDGFDVDIDNVDGYYKSFYTSIVDISDNLLKDCKSIYEVGCGSGTNLMIMNNRGFAVSGCDYSKVLCDIAKSILPDCRIAHEEAINIDDEKYDAVISDSVFAYFKSEEYAIEVLKKMINKANKRVVILEVFDKALEEECMAYRKSQIENYDELYEGLDKLFYTKDLFRDTAKSFGCDIEFTDVINDYYWNSRYMYNVIITKR